MKILRLQFLTLLLAMGGVPCGYAETEKAAYEPNQQMLLGERLVYKISWLRIPVGRGELQVKEKITLNGREVFHVVGMIETNKVLSKIFPIHDEAHSWIDAKTFESVQFEKKINELIIKALEKTVFDKAKRKGYFESFKTGEKKEFDITLPIHDVLSAFFWMRRQKFVPGESAKMVLSADQKDWELEVLALRKEKVKWSGGKRETLRMEPNTISEGVERKGKAWFNITQDSSQIPLRIAYKAPIGRIFGTLVEEETDTQVEISGK